MAAVEERKKAAPRKRKTTSKGLKLDLGCGQRKQEGYEGVDIVPGEGIDHIVDLFQFPWPFADRSVSGP